MFEALSKKLISIFEQAGVLVEGVDISILNKKSYKLLLSTKGNLAKEGIIINDFNALNTIWKMNILLARFVFKYSNFAENYLLALIENAVVLNKEKYIEIINAAKARLLSEKKDAESHKVECKRRNKIKSLNKCIEKISSLRDLKFVEKCTVYGYLQQSNEYDILSIDPEIFSKIRTLRNKAVHSDYIIKYFMIDTPFKNIESLYSLVDSEYQENFNTELSEIFNKYKLNIKFDTVKLNEL